MIDGALSALSQGGTKEVPLIDGRMLSVHASPAKGTSEKMAMGVSALPPNYSTLVHSHDAEEFALVVRGAGANSDGPMVVYWTYGPVGSESRWDPKGDS